jgi:hypothetical protein
MDVKSVDDWVHIVIGLTETGRSVHNEGKDTTIGVGHFSGIPCFVVHDLEVAEGGLHHQVPHLDTSDLVSYQGFHRYRHARGTVVASVSDNDRVTTVASHSGIILGEARYGQGVRVDAVQLAGVEGEGE